MNLNLIFSYSHTAAPSTLTAPQSSLLQRFWQVGQSLKEKKTTVKNQLKDSFNVSAKEILILDNSMIMVTTDNSEMVFEII